MAKFGKTGVTSDTPKKILFGAGTIHKNVTLLQMDTLTFEALYSAFQNVNHFKEC